jgi:hypothetical protein
LVERFCNGRMHGCASLLCLRTTYHLDELCATAA